MAIDRDHEYRGMAARGKYQRLYTHLCRLGIQEWRASFGEIESIIGFGLPASARLHRPWWANQRSGNGHSQALAGVLPDGRRPMSIWILKRCYSGESVQRPFASPALMRCGPSTRRQFGRKA